MLKINEYGSFIFTHSYDLVCSQNEYYIKSAKNEQNKEYFEHEGAIVAGIIINLSNLFLGTLNIMQSGFCIFIDALHQFLVLRYYCSEFLEERRNIVECRLNLLNCMRPILLLRLDHLHGLPVPACSLQVHEINGALGLPSEPAA